MGIRLLRCFLLRHCFGHRQELPVRRQQDGQIGDRNYKLAFQAAYIHLGVGYIFLERGC